MTDRPAQVGRYVIEAELASSVGRATYRAHDPQHGRVVALTLIRIDRMSVEGRVSYLGRLRREAEAAARCTSPYIAALHDADLHEGNPFAVWEYVDGLTLAEARAQDFRCTTDDAVSVAFQVVSALKEIHASGTAHGAIRPGTIMLGRDSRTRVIAFGVPDPDPPGAGGKGRRFLPPEYQPWQLVDARADLFATGGVLFELLAGRHHPAGPDGGRTSERSPQELAANLRDLCPGLPRTISAFVARSMAADPSSRFADADAMMAALKSAAAESGISVSSRITAPPRNPAALADAVASSTVILDRAAVATLERLLTELIGPIAKPLIRRALPTADTLEALGQTLASHVDLPAQRTLFEREFKKLTARSAAVGGIPAQEAERAQNELTRYAGPVARVMVKRAMARTVTSAALWQALADQIDDPAHRAAFLKKAPA